LLQEYFKDKTQGDGILQEPNAFFDEDSKKKHPKAVSLELPSKYLSKMAYLDFHLT